MKCYLLLLAWTLMLSMNLAANATDQTTDRDAFIAVMENTHGFKRAREIADNPQYWAWVDAQPEDVQLLANSIDPKSAVEAMQIYLRDAFIAVMENTHGFKRAREIADNLQYWAWVDVQPTNIQSLANSIDPKSAVEAMKIYLLAMEQQNQNADPFGGLFGDMREAPDKVVDSQPVNGNVQITSGSSLPADTITTITGITYTNATIIRVEPDGINYRLPNGIVKIRFEHLPKEIRDQYQYDPVKAHQHAMATHRAVQQRQEQIRRENDLARIQHEAKLAEDRRKTIENARSARSVPVDYATSPGYRAIGQRPVNRNNYQALGPAAHVDDMKPARIVHGGHVDHSPGWDGGQRNDALHIQGRAMHLDGLSRVDPVAAGHMAQSLSGEAHAAGMHSTGHSLQNIGHNLLVDPGYSPTHDVMTVPHTIHMDTFP